MNRRFFHVGVWSIIISLSPLAVIGLLMLLILLKSGGGEAGLCALLAAAELTFFAMWITPVTTILGTVLAIRALYLKKRATGITGLVINISLFCAAAGLLGQFYYRIHSNPDRLNIAVIHGDIATVEKLLNRSFDINHKYTNGETPLHEAVGNPAMAKLLISRGADINARDSDGRTPLFCLAALGTLGTNQIQSRQMTFEVADLLIQSGADIEAGSSGRFRTPGNGCTPLHAAADASYIFMIEKLVMAGANINAENSEGRTPLALAARAGHIEAAILLVEKGADLNRSGKNGFCPLTAAVESGKVQMVEYLLKAGADPNVDRELIHQAVTSTHDRNTGQEVGTDILNMLISMNVDINRTDSLGQTPLYSALLYCKMGTSQKEIVQFLLENGASPKIQAPKVRRKTCLDLVQDWSVKTEEQRKYRDEIISLLERYK